MADEIPDSPTKAARILIGGFALACAFRAVDHYEWPWTADSVASGGLAIVLTIVDWKLPWVLRLFGARTTQTLNAVATDARWLIGIGFGVFFLMSVSEGIYSLRDALNHPDANYLTWGPPPDSDYDGRPLGFQWSGAYLKITMVSPGNLPDIQSFIVNGKNLGTEEITLDAAYIISTIDSSKIYFKINAIPGGMVDISKAAPIPVGAPIGLEAMFAKQSMSEADFIKSWDSFDVIQAGEEKIRHHIDKTTIHRQLDQNHPELFPHVTQRK